MYIYIHTYNQRQLFKSHCPEVFCKEIVKSGGKHLP